MTKIIRFNIAHFLKVMATLIDLIGQQFGRLKVTGIYHKKNPSGMDEIFWVCECSCGGKKDVRGFSLRSGETQSCGCVQLETVSRLRKQSLTGMQFGRLTAGERIREKIGIRSSGNDRYAIFYECKCICGTIKRVQQSHLRAGSIKSCGCLLREMLPSTKYLPSIHFVIKNYKRGAKSRGLMWDLTDENVQKIVESCCYYCGDEPSKSTIPPDRKVLVCYTCNGIDRVDSSRGYTLDNVVPCCTRCNYAKRSLPINEFIGMCLKIASRHTKIYPNFGSGEK
ncbi:hypothetical protein HY469_05840 [Candidatus Roizmanbacteria bacterium]|nr:hypothetical protein [Candidatus Roizmanbacteria bacterium]